MGKHNSVLVNGGGAYGMPEDALKMAVGGGEFSDVHKMLMGGASGFGGMDASYFDIRPGAKTPGPGFGRDRFANGGNGSAHYHPQSPGGNTGASPNQGVYEQSQQYNLNNPVFSNYQRPSFISPLHSTSGGTNGNYFPAQPIGAGFLSNNAFGRNGAMGGGDLGFMQGQAAQAAESRRNSVNYADDEEGYIGVNGMQPADPDDAVHRAWSQLPDNPVGNEWTVLQPQQPPPPPQQHVRSPAEINPRSPSRTSFSSQVRSPSGPRMGEWTDAEDALNNLNDIGDGGGGGWAGRSGTQTAMSMDSSLLLNPTLAGQVPQNGAWSQQSPDDDDWTVMGNGRIPAFNDFM
jgi:hypothetical protein